MENSYNRDESYNEFFSFFSRRNFVLKERKFSEYFGNYYLVMSSPHFNVMVDRDKMQEFISISSLGDDANYFDLPLIRSYVNDQTIFETNFEEPEPMETLLSFFDDFNDRIKSLFNAGNYAATKIALEELREERAKQLFPLLYE